jgi:hypothetical protein
MSFAFSIMAWVIKNLHTPKGETVVSFDSQLSRFSLVYVKLVKFYFLLLPDELQDVA